MASPEPPTFPEAVVLKGLQHHSTVLSMPQCPSRSLYRKLQIQATSKSFRVKCTTSYWRASVLYMQEEALGVQSRCLQPWQNAVIVAWLSSLPLRPWDRATTSKWACPSLRGNGRYSRTSESGTSRWCSCTAEDPCRTERVVEVCLAVITTAVIVVTVDWRGRSRARTGWCRNPDSTGKLAR